MDSYFTVISDRARAAEPINVMLLAALLPSRLAGRFFAPGGILRITLPRFVLAGMFAKTFMICCKDIPAEQVIVPTAPTLFGLHVHGANIEFAMPQFEGDGS